MLLERIKKVVPRRVKRTVKARLQAYQFGRAMRALLRLPACEVPPVALIEELAAGWGNQGFAAQGDYLLEICSRAVRTNGPILECGSGLSTILLGILASRRDIPVWSLEHISDWAARSQKVLDRHQLNNVHLCSAPLRNFGEFDWYDPPPGLPPAFSLVICDGPPATVRGGRFGLLPLMANRLAGGAVILLDDTVRPGEEAIARRWASEFRVSMEMRGPVDRSYAILTCPAAPRLSRAAAAGT